MTYQYWGHALHGEPVSDDMGPDDLEALELYERARQGLSRTHLEEMET